MPYTPVNWSNGEDVFAANMNHIETGIAAAVAAAEADTTPNVEVISHTHIAAATFTPATDIPGWALLESTDLVIVYSTQAAALGDWTGPADLWSVNTDLASPYVGHAYAYVSDIVGVNTWGFATASKYDIIVVRGAVIQALYYFHTRSNAPSSSTAGAPLQHGPVDAPNTPPAGSKLLVWRSAYSGDDAMNSVTINGVTASGSVIFHNADFIVGAYDIGATPANAAMTVTSLPVVAVSAAAGVLVIASDPQWAALPTLPPYGQAGQVLKKLSSVSWDADWVSPSPPLAPPHAYLNVNYLDATQFTIQPQTDFAGAYVATEITLAAGETIQVSAPTGGRIANYAEVNARRVRDAAGALVAGTHEYFEADFGTPWTTGNFSFNIHTGAGTDLAPQGGGAGPWTTLVAVTGGTFMVSVLVSWAA